jgi:hypothetical protein
MRLLRDVSALAADNERFIEVLQPILKTGTDSFVRTSDEKEDVGLESDDEEEAAASRPPRVERAPRWHSEPPTPRARRFLKRSNI